MKFCLLVRSFAVLALLVFLKEGNITYADSHLLPNGVFVRVDNSLANVDVHVEGSATDFTVGPPGTFDSFEETTSISDEIGVAIGVTGIATSPSSLASAVNAGTASINTPFDGANFAPTVDSSLSLLGHASAATSNGAGTWANSLMASDHVSVRSAANGTFQLELSAGQTQAMFYGTLYLVGVGSSITTESERVEGSIGPPAVSTSVGDANIILDMSVASSISLLGIGTFGVQGTYTSDTELWTVTGTLPGGVSINESGSGVNSLFNFAVPVPDGITVSFSSSTGSSEARFGASAFGTLENPAFGTADLNWGLSASAWGVATPIGTMPMDGDFDGDGDVDDDDFGFFADNFPIDIGATQNEGDADGDGDVDSDDLQIWLDNTETPGIPGDFDSDADVDGSDFLAWQRGFGTLSGAALGAGDADRDEDVDSTDLSIWGNNFGLSAGVPLLQGATATIPEPSSLVLMVLLGLSMMGLRGNRCGSKHRSDRKTK